MNVPNNRMATQPINVPRTARNHDVRVLTSMPAGKMVPIAAIPMLREDAATGAIVVSFEMNETVELLLNAVNVDVKVYLVPTVAFERFNGMDDFNRSWEGVPMVDGGAVIPFVETKAFGALGANAIYKYLGKHGRPTQLVNTAYLEAYNLIWNFRAKNRSPDIALRTRLQEDLAPAFWSHQNFAHVVPDFDQAVIDGEVALNVVNSKMPVRGIGLAGAATGTHASIGVRETKPGQITSGRTGQYVSVYGAAAVAGHQPVSLKVGADGFPEIFAELQNDGITVSLSNIELARKTQAFAKLREQYVGHTDQFLIDMLMDGLSVPEQAWKQPMLLAQSATVFGMSKRYASDSGNLTESVVNGATMLDLRVNCPRVPTGGIIMVVAEVTPEQLFERQKDPYLHLDAVNDMPSFLRDHLDPEKVVIVKNEDIDLDHDTPNATFGYAPLNYQWNHPIPCIGGKFYRPFVDAPFDEDRQRIWAVETQNPTLSQDFYLCTTMHTKPFVAGNTEDPFEAVARGMLRISGNTVFGGLLVESTGSYDDVMADAPKDRIVRT